MRPNQMHSLGHSGTHDDDAPKAWANVPKLCGDYDLDATILHRSNKDLPDRLKNSIRGARPTYGHRTGYHSY